ncbi:MAG: hypothetical protein EXX96DRAFT_596581 [Benjaminiella poitrasii]|nr:MAG: hypothetical protein EXX96DRAFT_596581 [Benjaminiella poitrasii]
MLAHLSLFPKSANFPLLPLFVSSYRASPLCHRDLSIWNTIFETFDYFVSGQVSRLQQVPLETLLILPLHQLLLVPNDSHWTCRHPSFMAQHFFIYDSHQRRLRLRIQGEYTRFPRLCHRLFLDILHTRTIRLQDWVWPHILEEQPNSTMNWSKHPLFLDIVRSPTWHQYTADNFRRDAQALIEVHTEFPKNIISKFWTSSMFPQARTVMYRSFSKAIPCKTVLHKFGVLPNTPCSFCCLAEDNLRHFLVTCKPKWAIWNEVLGYYFPSLSISPEMLYGSLRYLHVPVTVNDTCKYFTVLSTVQWKLWALYWSHGNNGSFKPVPPLIDASLI